MEKSTAPVTVFIGPFSKGFHGNYIEGELSKIPGMPENVAIRAILMRRSSGDIILSFQRGFISGQMLSFAYGSPYMAIEAPFKRMTQLAATQFFKDEITKMADRINNFSSEGPDDGTQAFLKKVFNLQK